MDRAALITAIGSYEVEKFRQQHLFSDSCWIFEFGRPSGVYGSYADFRAAIASIAQVDKSDVRLVGSSMLGWSLHPKKSFRACTEKSDLDVVIVSEPLFLNICAHLRTAYFQGYSWVRERHSSDVFLNHVYLIPHSKSYQTTYLREMSKRMGSLSLAVFEATGLSRDLKYRIYRSWEDAHAYYDYNLRSLKEIINHGPQ